MQISNYLLLADQNNPLGHRKREGGKKTLDDVSAGCYNDSCIDYYQGFIFIIT